MGGVWIGGVCRVDYLKDDSVMKRPLLSQEEKDYYGV